MDAEHEALCVRCGRCCQEKKRLADGTLVLADTWCRFYDAGTKSCMVYYDKHRICDTCLPMPQALAVGIMPEDCPYAKRLPGYRSVVCDPTHQTKGR